MNKSLFRGVLLSVLVILLGGLCGFSLSGTGENMVEDAYGRIVTANKVNSVKQVTVNEKSTQELLYKETMNNKDLPATRRSDSYGTYDIYTDTQDNEYVFLLNSNLLCGYKAKDPTPEGDFSPASKTTMLTQAQAKEAAAAFMEKTFQNDPRTYLFESITPTQMHVYYIDYVSYINGIKTDDVCTMWVRADTGEISAWHAFNRGRYDGYTGKNLSLSGSHEKLQTALPFLQSTDYEIGDQYITLSDNGTLMLHYDIFYTQDGITIPHTFETPVA